jgi:hypothetical protein
LAPGDRRFIAYAFISCSQKLPELPESPATIWSPSAVSRPDIARKASASPTESPAGQQRRTFRSVADSAARFSQPASFAQRPQNRH